MSVTVHGLIFDSPTEARRFEKKAKADLCKAGWAYRGRFWFLKETRKPGKTLLIELPNWARAIEWERLMQGSNHG